MKKPKIGETLFIVKVSSDVPVTCSCLVVHVGRKYFTVESMWTHQVVFLLETWKQKPTSMGYGYDYELYVSQQAYEDEQERCRLRDRLRKMFEYGSDTTHTLEQYRAVWSILDASAPTTPKESE